VARIDLYLKLLLDLSGQLRRSNLLVSLLALV
jgi:hypothetical protein